MAESKEQKSLEARVAELEDKLSKMHVTEEEMKAYEKVAGLMGGGPAQRPGVTAPISCIVQNCWHCWNCWRCTIIRCTIITPECFECGPMSGSGGFGPSGFGGFGR